MKGAYRDLAQSWPSSQRQQFAEVLRRHDGGASRRPRAPVALAGDRLPPSGLEVPINERTFTRDGSDAEAFVGGQRDRLQVARSPHTRSP